MTSFVITNNQSLELYVRKLNRKHRFKKMLCAEKKSDQDASDGEEGETSMYIIHQNGSPDRPQTTVQLEVTSPEFPIVSGSHKSDTS